MSKKNVVFRLLKSCAGRAICALAICMFAVRAEAVEQLEDLGLTMGEGRTFNIESSVSAPSCFLIYNANNSERYGGLSANSDLGFVGTVTGEGCVAFYYRQGDAGVTQNMDFSDANFADFSGLLAVYNLWNNSAVVVLGGDGFTGTEYLFPGVSREKAWSEKRMYNDSTRGQDTLKLTGATTLAGITGTSKGYRASGDGVVSDGWDCNASEHITVETAGTVLTLAGNGEYAYYGSVGEENARVAIVKQGEGSQAFGGANFFDTVTVQGGTIDLSGATVAVAALEVCQNGTLDLSGTTVTVAAPIANAGAVVVSDSTSFDIGGLPYTETEGMRTYSVVTGTAPRGDWSAVTISLGGQRLSGVDLTEAGLVTIEVGTLVWAGTEANHNWNLADDNEIWLREGQACAFSAGDNATFGANGHKTVQLANGATLPVGKMIISDDYKFLSGTGSDMTTIEGNLLDVAAGKTLTVGASNHKLDLAFNDIQLKGKLDILTNDGVNDIHWKKLTFAADAAELYVHDAGRSLSIDETVVAANGIIKAKWSPNDGYNLGVISGNGNLTLNNRTDLGSNLFQATDISAHTGAITIGNGAELRLDLGAETIVKQADGATLSSASQDTSTVLTINSGKLILTSAANNFRGTVNINDGAVLEVGQGANLLTQYSNTARLNIRAGGELRMSDFSYEQLGASPDYAVHRNLDGGTLTIFGNTSNSGQGFSVSANGGSFIMLQAGETLTLKGNKNDNTVKMSGHLKIGGAGNIVINKFDSQAALIDLASLSGSLEKIGSGTVTLNCAGNTYSGGTTVSEGVLVVKAASALGTGPVTVGANGTLNLDFDANPGDQLLAGPVTLDPSATILLKGSPAKFTRTDDGRLYLTAEAQIGDTKYATLAEAIDAAADGAEIHVLPGVVITDKIEMPVYKSITILGPTEGVAKLTGGLQTGIDNHSFGNKTRNVTITIKNLAFETKGVLIIGAAHVEIESCTFTNITAPAGNPHTAKEDAIAVLDQCYVEEGSVSDVIVRNCQIDGAAEFGIYLRNPMSVTITDNTIANTAHNAITLALGSGLSDLAGNVTITDNTITNWDADNDSEGGRAIRAALGSGTVAKTVTFTGNVMTKTGWVENPADPNFVKITHEQTGLQVNLSGNYWNDENPDFATILNGGNVSVSSVANYYTNSDKAPEHLVSLAAKITKNGTTTNYATLAAAVEAAENGDIVELLADSAETISVVDKAVGIKFNGHTWNPVAMLTESECYAKINTYGYVVGDLECAVELLVNDGNPTVYVVGGATGNEFARRMNNNITDSYPVVRTEDPPASLNFYVRGKIRLSRNITLPSYNSNSARIIVRDGDVVIDLNGFTIDQISGNGQPYSLVKVESGRTLTIQDSSAAQTGTINAIACVVLVEGGHLIIEGGTLEVAGPMVYGITGDYGSYLFADILSFKDGGTVEMSGGTLTSPTTRNLICGEYVDGVGQGQTAVHEIDYSSYITLFKNLGSSVKNFISGGTFSMEPNASYIVENYEAVYNETDSMWHVQEMAEETLTVAVGSKDYFEVGLPFGKGEVRWQDMLDVSTLEADVSVKVPNANNAYTTYVLDGKPLTWRKIDETEPDALTLTTGDAIWMKMPENSTVASITLSGRSSATVTVEIKHGVNLVSFPTTQPVSLNDAASVSWSGDSAPEKLDVITTVDPETGAFSSYIFNGTKWRDTRYPESQDTAAKIIKAGQGFTYERLPQESLYLPKKK